ncbi:protein sax-3-like isoform X2 [Varroa destructor]|uniref:Uncharacterized protein n=1 Tax=Varroa destructor TaxID=109461 RepID=A0A7M7JGU8_VARDE|nr:protein sax-3-like isoform X2 [Varroa destructor]
MMKYRTSRRCVGTSNNNSRTANDRPKITRQPQDIVVLRDDPAQMTCGTEGAKKVQWFHKGRPIKGDRATTSFSGSSQSGVLFFLSVATQDTGVYWCEAVSKTGQTTRSQNVTLSIAYLREEFLAAPSDIEVALGETAVLQCEPPEGVPTPTVAWFKEGQPVNVGSKVNRLRLQEGSSSNLVIQDVRSTDQGNYICKADNMVGSRETPAAKLIVKSKPVIVQRPEDTTVSDGNVVRLECSATGDPQPTIRWTHNDKDVKELASTFSSSTKVLSNRSGVSSTLEVINLRPDDQGEYLCEVSNNVGTVKASARVSIQSRPLFRQRPLDQRVALHSTAVLHCVAFGSPSPSIFWSREDSSEQERLMFPNNTYGRITVDIEGTLTVTDVTKEDEGFYVCSALSALGSITARAHLEISTLGDTPPPLISVLPVNQTVPEGESVTVHCKAEPASAGSSAPNIRWLFNEKEIDEEDDDRITVEDTSLTIQDPVSDDSGLYTCIAWGDGRETRRSASLKVLQVGQSRTAFARAPMPSRLPSAPTKPTISAIDDTSVSLAWEDSEEASSDDDDDDDDEDSVEEYSIEWFSPDLQSGWVIAADRIQERKYTVTGLRPETRYVFTVRARNNYGLGRTSPISKLVTTGGGTISYTESGQPLSKSHAELNSIEVKIRSAKAINSTAVNLDWAIIGDREYIEGYYIWFRDISAAEDKYSMVTIWGGKRNRFTLKDLNKFTRYDIFLVPFLKTLKGPPSNIKTVTTSEDAPSGSVRDISVNVANSTSVWVQWKAPLTHQQNGVLQGYKLILLGEVETANRNVLTNQTHFVFINLIDKMRYRLQILAFTSVGDGPPSHFVELSTDENYLKHLAADAKDKEPWLVLLLSAVLCFILITISLGILFFLCKRQRDLKAVTVSSVPVSKGGDANHLFASLNNPVGAQNWSQVYSCVDATKEKEVLYENKVMNILDGVKYCTEYTPLNLQREEGEYAEVGGQQKLNTFAGAFAGFPHGHAPTFPEPYASTTILANLPVNPGHQRLPESLLHGKSQPGRQSVRSIRSNCGGSNGLVHPPSPHELEGLLQARKSFSDASNNGDSSSFSTRSGRSSRSSGRARVSGRSRAHHQQQQHGVSHQIGTSGPKAMAMRNLDSVGFSAGGGGHSDSTSVSEDDSTGVHSWSRTSTGGRRRDEEPIYNCVPEEQQTTSDSLFRGGGSDGSEHNNSIVGSVDTGVVLSSGQGTASNSSRDDDIMVPKYSRSLCTPLSKKKVLDLVPEASLGLNDSCSTTSGIR